MAAWKRTALRYWRQPAAVGLRIVERASPTPGIRGLLQAAQGVEAADIVNLRTALDPESRRVLFRGAAAVLAIVGASRLGWWDWRPWRLVGWRYGVYRGGLCGSRAKRPGPGDHRSVGVCESVWELRANPAQERALRRAGRATAELLCLAAHRPAAPSATAAPRGRNLAFSKAHRLTKADYGATHMRIGIATDHGGFGLKEELHPSPRRGARSSISGRIA